MKGLKQLKEFKYIGSLKDGRKTKGKAIGYTEDEIRKELKGKDIFLLSIKDKTPWNAKFSKPNNFEKGLLFEKIGNQLKNSGDILKIINNIKKEESISFAMCKYLVILEQELNRGKNISDAINSMGIYDDSTISIIKTGEDSGKLPIILCEVAELFYEKEKLKKTIRKAAVKPLLMLSMSFAILIFLLPRMISPMKDMIESVTKKSGDEAIPLITRIVMKVSDFITNGGGIILFLGIGAIVGIIFYMYKNNSKFKKKIDYMLINAPLLGNYNQYLSTYITMLSLNLLYKAGVTIPLGFSMILESQSNEAIKDDTKAVLNELKKGKSLNKAINQAIYITPFLKDMIAEGDISGTLERNLDKAKIISKEEYYESSNKLVFSTVAIIGTFSAVVVGVIILSVYLPIFSMSSTIMGSINAE